MVRTLANLPALLCLAGCTLVLDLNDPAGDLDGPLAADGELRHDTQAPEARPPGDAPPLDAQTPDGAPDTQTRDAQTPDALTPDALIVADDGPLEAQPACEVGERCDGLDNNCDGRIDEGLTRACGLEIGDCEPGRQACVGGAWEACEGARGPTEEICDGVDNDCDGAIDEDVTNACGGCGPLAEICDNGRDDDCDGLADCGQDPDCNGLRLVTPIWGGDPCRCVDRPVAEPCNAQTACDACLITWGEMLFCRKNDGDWAWRPLPDPLNRGACGDNPCMVSCCDRSTWWCDGAGVFQVGQPPNECGAIPVDYACP